MATTVTESAFHGGTSRTRIIEHSIPSGETGPWILLVPGTPCTVSLHPGTSGKLQFTTSRKELIDADTARAIDWSRGTVTSAVADIPEGPVTAVRGVSVSGTLVLELVQ